MAAKSPLGRREGRQALGWVADFEASTHPFGCATTVAVGPLSPSDRCRGRPPAPRQPPPRESDFLRRRPCRSAAPARMKTSYSSSSSFSSSVFFEKVQAELEDEDEYEYDDEDDFMGDQRR